MAKKEKKNVNDVIVKIDGDSWSAALDKVFKNKQKTVKVDGFRKGKVPRDIYEKKFGKESLFLDAANSVIEEAFQKALDESKLIPVVQPSLDIKSISEDGVEFIFKIITKPEVNVKKYKGLKVVPEKVKVTKEEVDHELGHLLERYTELVSKDGKVTNGDVAIIDFEGFKDGVAFDGGKGENYSLEIGSNTFIPGFEEQLVGLKAGDEKDLDLVFPEEYGAKDLAGAKVVFKVKVNEVKEKKTRELDEEFFEDLGMDGIDSKEALEKQVKENITAQKEHEAEDKYMDALLAKIAENTEIDVPETMINDETDRMVDQFAEHITMQGISIEQFYKFTNSTKETLKEQYKEEATKRIKYRLILEAIIKAEKITVSDKEVDEKIDEIAKKYNMTKEEVKKQYGENIDYIKYDLEVNKAFDVIKGE